MDQLVFIENGQAVTNSLKVSEVFEKEHRRVLQDIRDLECSDHFRQLNFEHSTYVNSQNKQQPMYRITENGLKLLVSQYRGHKARKASKILGLEIVNDDLEGKYLEIISDAFSHLRQLSQYQVGKYRIDLYFPDLNLAIEIDEKHHKRTSLMDAIRENYISTKIGCVFLRYNTSGNESIGVLINRIMQIALNKEAGKCKN